MDKKLDINLWIGSGGNVTPTHYDGESNFLSQIKGEKRIILYPPNEVSNMYPFPVFSRNSHISQVDFLDPNLEKYPKYKNVKSFECTLKSGEMLFIPVLWWHSVETISKELTISLNFWWRAPLRQYMTYLGARTLSNLLFHNSKTLLSLK